MSKALFVIWLTVLKRPLERASEPFVKAAAAAVVDSLALSQFIYTRKCAKRNSSAANAAAAAAVCSRVLARVEFSVA